MTNRVGGVFAALLLTSILQAQTAPSQPPGTNAVVLDETGSLVSVVGGVASSVYNSTGCNACYDMSPDASGNLIIAAGTEIRMISQSGTPLPASPIRALANSFYRSVAVDAAGNFIVADNQQHRILRITPNGSRTTVMYTYAVASPTTPEDVYVRVDAAGNYIVAQDNSASVPTLTMFSFAPNTSTATPITLRPSNSDVDRTPVSTGGLTFDASGNYMNVDANNRIVSTITPGGVFSNFLTNTAQLSIPQGISRDPVSGDYFLVDSENSALYLISPDGSTLTQIASGNLIQTPGSVVVFNTQPSTTTYVLESGQTIVPIGGNALTCSSNICTSNFYDFAADAAGNLIIANVNQLVKMTPAGVTTVIAAAPSGSQFLSVAVDSSGNYIVADNELHRLLKVTPGGTVTPIANYPVDTTGQLEDVTVRIDSSGNYVVADDNGEGHIVIVTPSGTANSLNLNGVIPQRISGLTFDANGNYVVADYVNKTIDTITTGGAVSVLFSNPNATLSFPTGLFRDPSSGNFLIADQSNGAIYALTPNGSQITPIATGFSRATTVLITGSGASSQLSISTTSLPAATVGSAYGAQLTASGGSGTYTWTVTGLPSGLGFSTNGSISGVPSAGTQGQWTVSVTVRDASNTSLSASQNFTLSVAPPLAPPVTISSSTSSISIVAGGSVSASFTAGGGTPPFTFSVNGPAGISISSSGALSGSVSQPGNFNATVTATDSQGRSASLQIAINALGLTTSSLPSGTAGQFYSATIAATGGSGALQFTATGLPSGISLSGGGLLSGTTRTPNTYSINVSVSSGGLTVSKTYSLTMAQPQPLSVSSANLPDGSVNTRYSQAFTASGGYPPYTWAVITGNLPQGLSMNASGIVSGTATTPGPNTFGIQVTDAGGGTASAAATLKINPAPLTITTQSLPAGMVNVDYPQQLLSATGGVIPYTWSISGGGLPAGVSLSGAGVIGGTPTNTGTFNPAITVTDGSGAKATATFAMLIRPFSGDLVLTASSLNFSINAPAASVPSPATVGVQSTSPAQTISYSISVTSSGWLSVTSGNSTPDTLQVSITPAALSLNAGSYSGTITVTCTSGSCNGHTQSVSVALTVNSLPPNLVAGPTLLAFATTSSNTSPISQPLTLQNSGGGSIGFASAACEAGWCSVAAPTSLGGGATEQIGVTVNPGLLQPGFYRTLVDIVSSAGRASVPVTLFIAPNATMTLAPAGTQFNAPAGSSPGNPNGSFLVSVNNPTPVNWHAAVIPGATWLHLATASGTSTTAQPGSVSYSIDSGVAAGLTAGAYYGRIEVTSGDVANSPQDYEVILNVAPANTAVTPDPEPAGLLFITSAGGVLPPQTVSVYSSSASPVGFQTSAATNDGGRWLNVTPSIGSAVAGTPGTTSVTVNTSGLRAGVYRGGVSYALSATAVRTVNVTLIVTSSGTATASSVSSLSHEMLPRDGACLPTALAPTQTGLVNNFSAPAAWPTPLSIQLSNDCGIPVGNGQVVATFSNGDPPLLLGLVDPTKAIYSGTWSPRKTAAQLAINLRASAPGLPAVTTQIAGAVTPNAVPQLTPNGELHSFDPLIGGALAPGTIIQIYGQNLASQTAQPSAVPLPNTLNGTQVLIGGEQSPLFYVSPTQINAQIPFDLLPGQQYQLIVSANGALTAPDTMQLSNATPGLAAFVDGTLIAQHSDGTLVSATAPAKAGEYLVAYLVGMGSTNVQLDSGAASPSSPLAQPTDPPTLLINGSQSPLLFAGLTPGLVGLYQMNFQVPAGLPAGTITVSITQDGVSSNQTTMPYQP